MKPKFRLQHRMSEMSAAIFSSLTSLPTGMKFYITFMWVGTVAVFFSSWSEALYLARTMQDVLDIKAEVSPVRYKYLLEHLIEVVQIHSGHSSYLRWLFLIQLTVVLLMWTPVRYVDTVWPNRR